MFWKEEIVYCLWLHLKQHALISEAGAMQYIWYIWSETVVLVIRGLKPVNIINFL